MKKYDGDTRDGEFVVKNHKKRKGEELRLAFKDYTRGKDMQKDIDEWVIDP